MKKALLFSAVACLVIGQDAHADRRGPAGRKAVAKPAAVKPAAAKPAVAPAAKPAAVKPAGSATKMPSNGASKFKSDEERFAYAMGFQIGSQTRSFIADGMPFDIEMFITSLRETMADKSKMTMQEVGMTMQDMRTTMMAMKKKKDGKYLADFKAMKGVKSTASGLLYRVIRPGTGKKPSATDTVKVHYSGTLTSGREFDSSYKRKAPAIFPVGGVIPGWTEALKLMKTGAKWEVVLIPELAYGPRGKGRDIPPMSILKFEVELLSIEAPAPKPVLPPNAGSATKPGPGSAKK